MGKGKLWKNRLLCFTGGIILSTLTISGYSQNQQDIQNILQVTNSSELKKFSVELQSRFERKRLAAQEQALKKGWVIKKIQDDGTSVELKELDKSGRPVYFLSTNLTSAKTISTNKVWSGGGAGLNLSGAGITLREWDESGVRLTHQEFVGRVTQVDAGTSPNYHSTHVAGTMLATGIVSNAHGMANQATLRAFDWNNDYSEMASEAANGALLSNASYVYITGWYYDGASWYWYGDPWISPVEDFQFGFYSSDAATVDSIAYSAPYFLACKASGNDRGAGPSVQPVSHYIWDGNGWVLSNAVRNLDGMPSGYDCISASWCVSKNVLTVGAVYSIPNGYSVPSDVVLASFSGTGPTDDGRIKPDIVADGISLYSSGATADNAYLTLSGTSMATPSVTGSMALLQEHYHNLHGSYMRSATLRGLVIHTADEAGTNPGPDYLYGWGLMNTSRAAAVISNNTTAMIRENVLMNGTSYSMNIKSNGTEPLRATICWTDPPGTPPPDALNPPDIMLINDLDLRIDGSTYKPWILNPGSPSSAATTGDNIRDNVEQIYIPNPGTGCHTLTVTHKGILPGGSQAFSLIITGISVYPDFTPGSISGNQDICSTSVPALLTAVNPTGGNAPYSYQWQSSPDSLTFSDIPGATGINYQPGLLASSTYFRQVQSSQTSCNSAQTNSIKIRVVPLPSAATPITGPTSILPGQTGVAYSLPVIPAATGYQWTILPGAAIVTGSNSNSITVNFPASDTSGNISVQGTNACGQGPGSSLYVGVGTRKLNIGSLLLEGLYVGYGVMRKAADGYGDHFAGDTADVIHVELHPAMDYSTVKYSRDNVALSTSGRATVSIPRVYHELYYLTIKHRNSIETTSALPLDFSGSVVSYEFDAISKAYDGNMMTMDEENGSQSPPLIYGGDVNQDGQVEAEDLNAVGNAASAFVIGYFPTDVYGDGQVEATDMNITANNASMFIYAHLPM